MSVLPEYTAPRAHAAPVVNRTTVFVGWVLALGFSYYSPIFLAVATVVCAVRMWAARSGGPGLSTSPARRPKSRASPPRAAAVAAEGGGPAAAGPGKVRAAVERLERTAPPARKDAAAAPAPAGEAMTVVVVEEAAAEPPPFLAAAAFPEEHDLHQAAARALVNLNCATPSSSPVKKEPKRLFQDNYTVNAKRTPLAPVGNHAKHTSKGNNGSKPANKAKGSAAQQTPNHHGKAGKKQHQHQQAAAVARTPLAAVTNNTNAAAVARTPMSAMSAKSFGSSAKPPTAGAKRSKAARRARQQATKKAAGGRGGVQAAGKLRPPMAA